MNKNHRNLMLLAGALIVVVLGLIIWRGVSQKDVDSLPSLAQIAELEDEGDLNQAITHFTREELQGVWGEPEESTEGADIWVLNESTKFIVNYHNNEDRPVVCGILRE